MTTRAVLVAIERYDGDSGWNRLRAPVNDALVFAKWLIGNGVDPACLHVRISAHNEVTARAAFEDLGIGDIGLATADAVQKLFNESLLKWPGGELIAFWSGHGWFRDQNRYLCTSEANNLDMRLLDFQTLLVKLRSDHAKSFFRQHIFVDACAKFMPSNIKAYPFTSGAALETIEQNCFYAASPGKGAAESQNEGGWFNAAFWNTLEWPLQPRTIRDLLEKAFDNAVQNGVARQQPMAIAYSLGKSVEPTWRGVVPAGDELLRLAWRARLTPKLLENLARKSALCETLQTAESRDRLQYELAKASDKPFNRPSRLRDHPILDFQFLWAFACENHLEPVLLREMNQTEGSSTDYAAVEDFAKAAPQIHSLIDCVADQGLPASLWRAWTAEYARSADLLAANDLEDLFELFFLSMQSAGTKKRLVTLLSRAYAYSPHELLADWIRDFDKDLLGPLDSQPPAVQFVYLECLPDPKGRLCIQQVKIWRGLTKRYHSVDLQKLGLNPDPDGGVVQQLDALNQILTAEYLIAPDIPDVVYELGLPLEELPTGLSHHAGHAVLVRWWDRLSTRASSLGTGEWMRQSARILRGVGSAGVPPRAVWLTPEQCAPKYVLAYLRGDGFDRREVIGLKRCFTAELLDQNVLREILCSGVPIACWHLQDPGDWSPVEPAVQELIDKCGLPSLPVELRRKRIHGGILERMALFYDDPDRYPYAGKLTGAAG